MKRKIQIVPLYPLLTMMNLFLSGKSLEEYSEKRGTSWRDSKNVLVRRTLFDHWKVQEPTPLDLEKKINK